MKPADVRRKTVDELKDELANLRRSSSTCASSARRDSSEHRARARGPARHRAHPDHPGRAGEACEGRRRHRRRPGAAG